METRPTPTCSEDLPKPTPCPGLPPEFWNTVYGKILAVLTSILLQSFAFGFVVSFSVFMIASIYHALSDNSAFYYINLFIVGNIFFLIAWGLSWIFFYVYNYFEPSHHAAIRIEENEPIVPATSLGNRPGNWNKECLVDHLAKKNKHYYNVVNSYTEYLDGIEKIQKESQNPCRKSSSNRSKKEDELEPKINIVQETDYHCKPYKPCEFHVKPLITEDDGWYTRLYPETDDPTHDIQTYDTLHLIDPATSHIQDRDEYLEKKRKEYLEKCNQWNDENQNAEKAEKTQKKSLTQQPKCKHSTTPKKKIDSVDDDGQRPSCSKTLSASGPAPKRGESKSKPCNPCHCGEERKVYTTKDQRGVRYETIPSCQSTEPPDTEVRKLPRFGPKAPAFQYFKTDANFM